MASVFRPGCVVRLCARLSWANVCVLALLTLFGGCALRSSDVSNSQFLDYPAPVQRSGESIPHTLLVYQFLLDPSVDDSGLTISKRKDDDQNSHVHRWQANPSDMITDLIRRDLQSSGIFKRIVDQFSMAPYRYSLDGTVRELDAIVRDGKVLARIRIDVNLTDFEAARRGGKTLLKKEYHTETPASDMTYAAIVASMNRGLSEFSSQLRSDIRTAVQGTGQLH
jgi:ABC-type uncharacterized transport system auxiliary subunit